MYNGVIKYLKIGVIKKNVLHKRLLIFKLKVSVFVKNLNSYRNKTKCLISFLFTNIKNKNYVDQYIYSKIFIKKYKNQLQKLMDSDDLFVPIFI